MEGMIPTGLFSSKVRFQHVPFTSEVRFRQVPFTLKLDSSRPVFLIKQEIPILTPSTGEEIPDSDRVLLNITKRCLP